MFKKAHPQQDMASRSVCEASSSCTPHPVNMCLTARSLTQDTMVLQQPWHCEQCIRLPLWLTLLVSHQSYIEHIISVPLVCLHEAQINKKLAISFLASALQETPLPKRAFTGTFTGPLSLSLSGGVPAPGLVGPNKLLDGAWGLLGANWLNLEQDVTWNQAEEEH